MYGPALPPQWEDNNIVIGATGVTLVWLKPTQTYGLVVNYYDVIVYRNMSEFVTNKIQGKPVNWETDKWDIRLIGMKFWKRIRV